jgi:hypothetical protein
MVSRYLTALNLSPPKLRNVVIQAGHFNSATGLLVVSSYDYRDSSAPWPVDTV